MCGITGWLDWERNLTEQRSTVEAMASTLALRGPDAGGVWIQSQVALAHRRLIVIDPEGGLQPMTRRFGERTVAITYNGEIYNFRELRSQLQGLGHTFETRSDTEVLLHAYVEWGTACVNHLIGIFAFAIWDEQKQQLFLARDHLGVKPLFYAQRGSAVLFGSEMKALLKNPLVKPEIDTLGLQEIFSVGTMRTPGIGVFKNVHELRAGHIAVCNRDGVKVERYWQMESHEHTHTLDQTVLHVRELLEDIVERQLISDMPVCTLLSGGLDSSGATALAGRILARDGRKLDTYTIDFTDSEKHFKADIMHRDLDGPWAKRVAEYVGTNHHTVEIDTPDLIEHILAPMRARDLPSAGEVETSLYLLFKQLKPHATVVLSGESADEVFGGYPWFYRDEFLEADNFPWLLMSNSSKFLAPDLVAKLRPDEYIRDRYNEAVAEVPTLPGESKRDARRREVFYLNQTRFLSFMLDRKDRMSMAASLEVRVPFCDHRLVQYMWNVPWEMKYVDNIEKGLLRRALNHVLPEDVLYRRKTAYPFTQNPSYFHAVRAKVANILKDPNSPLLPLLDEQQVRALTENETMQFDKNFGAKALIGMFDQLISIDNWMREYHVTLV